MPVQPPKKRQDIDKLRRILDNPDDPTLTKELTPDDTNLDSVRRRLSTKPQPTTHTKTTPNLQPHITIRQPQPTTPTTDTLPTWTPTTEPTTTDTLPLWTPVDTTTPTHPIPATIHADFSDQPLYEIEHLQTTTLQFQPITTKEEPQPFEPVTEPPTPTTEPIPDWELVTPNPDEPPTVPLQEFTEVTTEAAPEPSPSTEPTPPVEQKLSWRERRAAKKTARIQNREAKRREQLTRTKTPAPTPEPTPPLEPETPPEPQPPIIPPQQPPVPEALHYIPSIDPATAELLMANGYETLEQIRQTPISSLVKIKGIKRKHAKQIKHEVDAYLATTVQPPELEPVPPKKRGKKAKKNQDADTEEWESYTASDELHTPPICTYEGYTLYQRVVKSGRKKTVQHFFTKTPPEEGIPASLPDGFEIGTNRRTGVPYLKKKR